MIYYYLKFMLYMYELMYVTFKSKVVTGIHRIPHLHKNQVGLREQFLYIPSQTPVSHSLFFLQI